MTTGGLPKPWLWSLACVSTLAGTAHASAPDLAAYDLTATEWNGLSSLAIVAAHAGVQLEHVDALDLATDAPDVVVAVYPEALPAEPLMDYVEAGGSLFVADDFGGADTLLAAFGLTRVGAGAAQRYLDENPALPIVTSVGLHAVSTGVPEIALNHPSGIRGAGLPVFAFADGTGAVFDMSLGEGAAVFVADASLLTNLMLPLSGNARLVTNAFRRLCPAEGACRAALVTGTPTILGPAPEGSERSLPPILERLEAVLERLQEGEVSPQALRGAAALLLAGVLVLLGTLFPRAAPEWLSRRFRLRAPRPRSQFEFNVSRFTARPREPSMALPAALLRERFEQRFYPALSIDPSTATRERAWYDDAAAVYARRFEPTAGSARRRRIARTLRAIGDVPKPAELGLARHRWVEPKDLLRWSRDTRELLQTMEIDE